MCLFAFTLFSFVKFTPATQDSNTNLECHLLLPRLSDSFVPKEQSQDVLVVAELDLAPVDAFLRIDRLLRRKDERVEEILELLIRHIDAQLLKAVVGEVLKPRQVKDTDGVRGAQTER